MNGMPYMSLTSFMPLTSFMSRISFMLLTSCMAFMRQCTVRLLTARVRCIRYIMFLRIPHTKTIDIVTHSGPPSLPAPLSCVLLAEQSWCKM